jgi:tRNA A37 threonylcarbamoyladenosine dehydratase
MMADIDPSIVVHPIWGRVTLNNADAFVEGHDMVVDAVDDTDAKLALIQAAKAAGIPIVCSMGAGNRLDPTRFRVSDISATHTDPLSRVMRKLLRDHEIRDVPVVWSDETPLRVPPDALGGHSPASIATVPPAAGLALAAYVVKTLLQ